MKVVHNGNNVIVGTPSDYAHLNIQINGMNNTIEFGSDFKSNDLIIIITGNNAKISFGTHCKISGSIFCGTNSTITIGNHFKCNHPVHFRAFEERSLSIGDGCLFANVRAETSDYHTIFDLTTQLPINSGKDIIVGDRVWCARDVILAKGAEIGNDVVVGARAFVNKKFGSNMIIAGCPATIIRENVAWTEERGAKEMPSQMGVIIK